MVCYSCGCRLSEHDFCTGCGADVSLYKRVIFASNYFYNQGLEKATVRDLTGAIACLRQSVKLNKNNIDARNLLGLVYFEMGEVVAALSEWVISKNLRAQKNIADDYIEMIQSNQARLDSINQTIKKYNQALAYCYHDSLDLAVIQLKKVLSYNPNYIRAHQLLALLYIKGEEWEKAKKELAKCSKIDTNNTTTLRYLKEVEHMLTPEEPAKNTGVRKNKKEETVRYRSGTETIIQPVNVREKSGVSSLINLGIGVIIGLAIAVFLILPARVQNAKADIDNELRTVSEQSDAKTATIDEQTQKIKNLEAANASLQAELENYVGTDGALQATDNLLLAVNAYLEEETEIEKVGTYLDVITDEEITGSTSAFRSLYGTLLSVVGPQLSQTYYTEGMAQYKDENYLSAITSLEKAVHYDADNRNALFNLANAYRRNDEIDKAKEAYARVIELFPGTESASRSNTHLAEINNANTNNG